MSEPDGLLTIHILLVSDQSPRNIVAGVVALAFADGTQRALPAPLAAAIGAELLAAQIVTGLTLAN